MPGNRKGGKKNQKKGGRPNGSGPVALGRIPRPVLYNSARFQTFEFEGVFSPLAVTRAMLRKAWFFATSTTSAFTVIDAVKVLAVRLYSAYGDSTTSLGYTNIQIEWNGTYSASSVQSARGTPALPAALVSRPPPLSLAANWGGAANDADGLFTVLSDNTYIIQIDCQIIFANGTGTAITGVGATNQQLNYNMIQTLRPTAASTVSTVFV